MDTVPPRDAAAAAEEQCDILTASPFVAGGTTVQGVPLLMLPPPMAQPVARAWDVFVSYRRDDAWLVDAFVDKATLCGLRVFKDRAGVMSGRPFADALFEALAACAVFTPVLTRAAAAGIAAACTPGAAVDYMLSELVCALQLHARGALRMLYPVLVGPEESRSAGRGRAWAPLLTDPAFRASVVAANAVPVATLAHAHALCLAHTGRGLSRRLAAATGRELLRGAAAAAAENDPEERLIGILGFDACLLEGPVTSMDALVRGSYAAFVRAQLRPGESLDALLELRLRQLLDAGPPPPRGAALLSDATVAEAASGPEPAQR